MFSQRGSQPFGARNAESVRARTDLIIRDIASRRSGSLGGCPSTAVAYTVVRAFPPADVRGFWVIMLVPALEFEPAAASRSGITRESGNCPAERLSPRTAKIII
jgi:hypothetical protein